MENRQIVVVLEYVEGSILEFELLQLALFLIPVLVKLEQLAQIYFLRAFFLRLLNFQGSELVGFFEVFYCGSVFIVVKFIHCLVKIQIRLFKNVPVLFQLDQLFNFFICDFKRVYFLILRLLTLRGLFQRG